MVRFFYKEKESVNAKVLKVCRQFFFLPSMLIKNLKKKKKYILFILFFKGCQVPAYAGRLRAVHHRAPGENAAY